MAVDWSQVQSPLDRQKQAFTDYVDGVRMEVRLMALRDLHAVAALAAAGVSGG